MAETKATVPVSEETPSRRWYSSTDSTTRPGAGSNTSSITSPPGDTGAPRSGVRGAGGSDGAGDFAGRVTPDRHADDVAFFLSKSFPTQRAVLIAHSHGGLAAMKLLEKDGGGGGGCFARGSLGAMALLCSIPPVGRGRMFRRSLRRSPRRTWCLRRGLATKKIFTDPELCRQMFFDDIVGDEDLRRYMKLFKRDSKVTVDVGGVARDLTALSVDDGRAEADARGGGGNDNDDDNDNEAKSGSSQSSHRNESSFSSEQATISPSTDEDLRQYMKLFKCDSKVTFDVRGDARDPTALSVDDGRAEAEHGDKIPCPVLVLGGTKDYIVDAEAVEETARFFGVTPTMVESPHDVMLVGCWQNAANAINDWLEGGVNDVLRAPGAAKGLAG